MMDPIKIALLLPALLMMSCASQQHINLGVSSEECLPGTLLDEYLEQMQYLALRDTSRGEEKRARLQQMSTDLSKVRNSLEQYRKDYGYSKTNCPR